ncbi:MAG: hypothetical protein AAFY99_12735 [Pseudomonadota bacterium]
MHILLAVICAIGVAAFWFYRIRDAGRASGGVIGKAQQMHGNLKRRNFRNQAAQSPIDAIDDPVVGGATAIIAIAKECESWSDETQEKLLEALLEVGEKGLVEEAIIYGDWATEQFTSQTDVLRRLAPLVASMLDQRQCEKLMDIVERVVPTSSDNKSARQSALTVLRQKLGLLVDYAID